MERGGTSIKKAIFFGTPEYVLPVLEALRNVCEVVFVVTQPDKPVGRKQTLTPSPVKQWSESHNIPVFTPEKLDEQFLLDIKTLLPIDVGILAAYGNLIPQEVLDLAPFGMLNVHPSLLPKYRGTSPVQAAISAGDKQTGVSLIKMDDKHDHGPIIAQATEDIRDDDTTGMLRTRLFEKGAEILTKALPAYLEGKLKPREQDHSKATFVRFVKKEHALIPSHYLAAALKGNTQDEKWEIPFIKNCTLNPTPYTLNNFIRAMDPWPLAYTNVKLTINNVQVERRLKLLKAHLEESPITKLVIDEVQLEGKSPVSWKQFRQGYPEVKL